MLLSAPAQGKDSSPIHGSSTRRGRHRCGHDGQRKCVAHMPTAATTTEDSRSKFGRKLPTRLHDEAYYFVDAKSVITAPELESLILGAGMDQAHISKVMEFLMYYGVIGLQTDDG